MSGRGHLHEWCEDPLLLMPGSMPGNGAGCNPRIPLRRAAPPPP
ncbi:hypothetical protein HMPREF9946_01735, partial [Acetobacteraceae bacterium AT-5844]